MKCGIENVICGRKMQMYENYVKRGIDVVLSACAMIALLLPMLVVAVTIKIDSPGPVLFRQKRVGIHKKAFTIFKFRSMPEDTPHDMPTHLLENPELFLSPWQKWIRKTSIDELPQIWNILKGDMAIVGPRPALWNQEDLIAERERYGANDVKPGLTGYAQISGRDKLSVERKAELDGEYAEKISFFFDLRLFFQSVLKVLQQEDVVEGASEKPEKVSENKGNGF